MKFSFEWLKELSGYKGSAQHLAELLSVHAFETELTTSQKEFSGIIVAKVLKVEKHPNADRLRVVELTDGKNIISPVVCGAWNFEAGAIVPLALPGAIIPHDQHDPENKSFILTKATIRGIESQGMICSAKELGLGSNGDGIMVLDESYQLGSQFGSKVASKEAIFDISVPANRPDLLSYRGVAWEISALTGSKFKSSPTKFDCKKLRSKILKVRIADQKLCKRYVALRFANVQIKPSPDFIKQRLAESGYKSHNNVIDITNYVMLATGQPLHAFDASKVFGAINVRNAFLNESIETLDKINRKLATDILVIADSKKPLAIAGVIGGAESDIKEFTSEIILESANFNAVSVRKTSRALGLRTEASARFEKSLPLELTDEAVKYAAELLGEYASAKVLEYAEAGLRPVKPPLIKLDPEKVNNLLGTKITAGQQKKILERFGFQILNSRFPASPAGGQILVPFWRPDVRAWQDLAEEIARFEGLEKIVSSKPLVSASAFMTDPIVDAADSVRDLLVDMGYDEIYTYSFVSGSDLTKWQIDKKIVVEVANPLSLDQQYLRPNLALNILKIAEENRKNNEIESAKYFEIGHVYWKEQDKILEKTYLFMFSFPRTKARAEELIGDFNELAARLGIEFQIRQHQEQLAEIQISDKTIGHIGTVAGVSKLEWMAVNLDFEQFIEHKNRLQFKSISRFPSITLDVSILVKEEIPWIEIKKIILLANLKLVSQINLIEDSYKGRDITPGKKSITFRVVYQASDRTLTRNEVNLIHSQLLAELKQKLNAQIRD